MNWQHFIDAARILAEVDEGSTGRGRPRQVRLRRAVSTAYYAMFHAVCASNADALIGATPSIQGTEPWSHAYRAPDHRPIKNRLEEYGKKSGIHPAISAFASTFGILQEQRFDTDYDPQKAFTRREVDRLINRAEAATATFVMVPLQDRRDLAAYLVLFRKR